MKLITKSSSTLQHFINGQFQDSLSGETFETTNPATQKTLAQVSRGQKEDVNLAVKAAQQAFDSGVWSQTSMKERCRILRKIGDLILENQKPLAEAETQDTGKPITESFEGDIPRSAANFHFFADDAMAYREEAFTIDAFERHFAVREPLGVVGLITPWNLPLYLATWKIAPSLAMGNSVVLKPAEWTPYTATLLAQLCQEAGLPPGVFNIVHGFGAGEAGEALTTHEGVSAISFTGETGTGKAIMAASAPTLKKISFELGGKGANILFPDANLDIAIPTALRSAFRNQGQICLAGSRLFVHTSILEEVIERMSEGVKAIRLGDPMDPNTQMGALISKEHFLKVKDYAERGAVEGHWICGGKAPTPETFYGKDFKIFEGGNFITPGLYTAKPGQTHYAKTSFCQEEIFGPLLPIIPFENETQVIEQFNSTPYGLSCSLWSQDVNRCHRVSQKIKTGIVWVNCWFARDLRTPFGGQKASGIGREGGRYSLEFFSEAKTICYRYEADSV